MPACPIRTLLGRHRLFHVLELLAHVRRSHGGIFEAGRNGELLRQELLVFVGVRTLGNRFAHLRETARRGAGGQKNRADVGKGNGNASLVRGWGVFKSGQALLAEFERWRLLFVVEKGGASARLLVERVGVPA